MSKLLHPGNSWKLLKREAMRLFLLWYAALGEQAGDQVIIAQCLNKNFSPNILKCERRCMQYLQPWCQASPLLTPTWGSLLSQLLPQSQVYYLCSKSFSPKIFLFAFARSEMLSYSSLMFLIVFCDKKNLIQQIQIVQVFYKESLQASKICYAA